MVFDGVHNGRVLRLDEILTMPDRPRYFGCPGVLPDGERCKAILQVCAEHSEVQSPYLAARGKDNSHSDGCPFKAEEERNRQPRTRGGHVVRWTPHRGARLIHIQFDEAPARSRQRAPRRSPEPSTLGRGRAVYGHRDDDRPRESTLNLASLLKAIESRAIRPEDRIAIPGGRVVPVGNAFRLLNDIVGSDAGFVGYFFGEYWNYWARDLEADVFLRVVSRNGSSSAAASVLVDRAVWRAIEPIVEPPGLQPGDRAAVDVVAAGTVHARAGKRPYIKLWTPTSIAVIPRQRRKHPKHQAHPHS